MKPLKIKTKFPAWLWLWTGAKENLFELSKEDLQTFKLLALEASK
ncbi:hypothetical protein UFOVP148_14 [uncultured Caudovirales phage]|uniref:Uncharacterized protein n=1 Tax=uncultured Caudovirales phage TaxID=2100421 RepID=A0A6J7W691_9CAUD|nr:hypothetical protein UFOVP148_14 [uncultured Caudovirales phage]